MEGDGTKVDRILELIKGETDRAAIAKLAEEAIQCLQPDDNPTLWAGFQYMLGAALVGSAKGQFTPELFARVLAAYQNALTVFNPEQSPALWAQTQRNVGATYMGAFRSGIGERRLYVEQAITAYEMALRIPPEGQNPGTWLSCQTEMAMALSASAEWRGASALIASARAYEAALSLVTREASPEQWALLNLKIADSLWKGGADQYAERTIPACEAALLVLRRETHTLEWARANLLLGGLYRTRRLGSREENLERSIVSLDNALSVYTRETAFQAWYEAHYHRGPAWLHRIRGDRDSNLIQARESFQIAIDLTSREQSPEVWASLQVGLGQAFLDCQSGDIAANIESAIVALEAAYSVLRPDAGSVSWKLAGRMLGPAYLGREQGDVGENIARAIVVLTALYEKVPEPDDPREWAAAVTNLALAWIQNPQGDPQGNRAKAIEYLENAVRVPADAWDTREQWSGAARRLAILYLDEKAKKLGKPSASRRATGNDTSWVEATADPLDMADHASKVVEALEQIKATGRQALDLDTGWHAPGLLNEEVQLLRKNLNKFLEAGTVIQRNAEQREQLEKKRLGLFRAILAHLTEKYKAARRTTNLFREVERGNRPFVLLLRGFGMREQSYPEFTVGYGGGDQFAEGIEKYQLAMKLDPVPLVWIGNPVESGTLELERLAILRETASNTNAGRRESEVGFRVESGATWQRDVRTLIAAATFIVIHNPEMTPGVTAEVEIVRELGRLEDTFFYSPDKAAAVFTDIGASFHSLTEERIAALRETAKGRTLQPGTLPAATCAWVDGLRKQYIDAQTRGISRWVKQIAKSRSRLSMDLELDGYYYLLADLVMLEAVDRIPAVLSACAEALFAMGDESLQDATQLGGAYLELAGRMKSASDQTSAMPESLERLAETLRIVAGGQPEIQPS